MKSSPLMVGGDTESFAIAMAGKMKMKKNVFQKLIDNHGHQRTTSLTRKIKVASLSNYEFIYILYLYTKTPFS